MQIASTTMPPVRSGVNEVTPWILFDRVQISVSNSSGFDFQIDGVSQTQYSLFQKTRGVVFGNIPSPGRLNQDLDVERVFADYTLFDPQGYAGEAVNASDLLAEFVGSSICRLFVNQKEYVNLPLSIVPSLALPWQAPQRKAEAIDGNAGSTTEYLDQTGVQAVGMQAIGAGFPLNPPIRISRNDSFEVELTVDTGLFSTSRLKDSTGSLNFYFGLYLCGKTKRFAQ